MPTFGSNIDTTFDVIGGLGVHVAAVAPRKLLNLQAWFEM